MKEKKERHRIIRDVVERNLVSNQEELSALLSRRGLSVAQATLSRDIREMRISKVHDDSGYYYRLPKPDSVLNLDKASAGMFTDSITGVEFSGQIGIVHTRPGHASMVAAAIDGNRPAGVMGTIAGDDTVLVILREGIKMSADDFISDFKK